MRVLTTACTPCPASFAPRSCTVMWMQSRSPTFQRVPPCSFAVSSPASHPQVMHCYVNAKEVTNIPPFCLGLICCVLPCPRPPGHALLCGCKGGHQHATVLPWSPLLYPFPQVMHCYVDAMEFTDMQFDDAIRAFLSGFRCGQRGGWGDEGAEGGAREDEWGKRGKRRARKNVCPLNTCLLPYHCLHPCFLRAAWRG